jgi:prolipoprotein diacylglyceryltransferase
MEFTLLGAALLATLAALATLRWEAGRTNAADCTRVVWDALIGASVIGLIAGRLVAMIGQGTNPLTHVTDILLVRGGVDTVAAAAVAVVTYAWLVRSDLWTLLDAGAVAALAGLAGWHAGCLVRDTCLGSRTSVPWALDQSAAGIGRHPVEIYAAIGLVLAALLLVGWKATRRPPPGVIASVAFAAAALTRLATEPLRLGLGDDLSVWYAAAAAGGMGAAWWRWRVGASD